MEEQYAVLIGDIIESRKYDKEARDIIQELLLRSMYLLNRIFESTLRIKPDFTTGDEFQGLFLTATDAYMYYRYISLLMYPVKIRAGIGIGQWNVRMDNLGTQAQDGTAYHRARKAIQDIRQFKTQCVRIESDTSCSDINVWLNASLGLSKQLTARQHMVYSLIECLFPLMVCRRLNIQYIEKLPEIFLPDEIENPQFSISPIQLIGQNKEPEELAFPRGMSQNIAEIINTSRQNIENIISAGNLLEIRTLDIQAIFMLHKGENL